MKKKQETPFQAGMNSFIKRLGLSQRKLSEKIGRSNMAVSQWCLGRHEPKVGDIDGLIRLGMTAEEIFGKELAGILMKNTDPDAAKLDDATVLEIKKKAMEAAYTDLFKEKLQL